MNKVILMGRLVRDPEVRYSGGENATAYAHFTLAVDRRMRRTGAEGEQTADFIRCTAFGKSAEFAEKYLRQGVKIVVVGRIQTGSYTNRDGQKVYTTDVMVEEMEFAESKAASDSYRAQGGGNNYSNSYSGSNAGGGSPASANPGTPDAGDQGLDDFMNMPSTLEDELPFK